MSADRLAAGEPSLEGDLRVTVHGLLGDVRRLPSLGVRSAELKVGFPASPGAEFRAWSYSLLPVLQLGPSISFTVPIDGGLSLALETETFGSERFETVLSTGREPGVPKLRAGRYLIAPGVSEVPRRFDAARSEPMIELSIESSA